LHRALLPCCVSTSSFKFWVSRHRLGCEGKSLFPKVRFKCGLLHPLSLSLSLSFSSRHPFLRNSYVIKLEHCLSLVPPFLPLRNPPLEASEGTHNLFCRVGSIHLSSLGILGKQDALSAGPDFLGAVGILHATTHERADLNSRTNVEWTVRKKTTTFLLWILADLGTARDLQQNALLSILWSTNCRTVLRWMRQTRRRCESDLNVLPFVCSRAVILSVQVVSVCGQPPAVVGSVRLLWCARWATCAQAGGATTL
jgi:hypothetical protein